MGTFGFLLPHKGTLELVEAVDQLRATHPDILLLALCARYPHVESKEYEDRIRAQVAARGMEDNVLLLTDYLSDEAARVLLRAADVIVLPYRDTGESSSAALRFVLPLGRAIAVTDQPLFDDARDAVLVMEANDVDGDRPVGRPGTRRRAPCREDLAARAEQRSLAFRWERVVAEHRRIYAEARRAARQRRGAGRLRSRRSQPPPVSGVHDGCGRRRCAVARRCRTIRWVDARRPRSVDPSTPPRRWSGQVTPSLRAQQVRSLELPGRRVRLATLVEADYPAWLEVRNRCRDWLVPWEPRSKGSPLPAEDHASFVARCAMRERERQLGSGFGFGIFYEGRFVGEVTLSSILRGPFQNGSIGYWVDQRPGRARNRARGGGRRAAVRLRDPAPPPHRGGHHPPEQRQSPGGRQTGPPRRGRGCGFLEINGEWEDHVRYAMTSEEWYARREELTSAWTD